MVGPIDYRLNVLDPIQGYLQGLKFAEDRETVRLGREATRQNMDIQAAQEARAAKEFQMQRAEAARAVAEAQRGQQVLSQLFSNPNPTSEDFTQAFVANPAIREEIKFLMDRQTAEQTRGQLVAAQNVYAAAAQRNPEVLGRILTEQRDAMAASGNEPMVKLLDEGLRLLEADPETAMQQLRASTGLTILGLGGDVQKINEAIGVGFGEPTGTFKTLQERARAAGLVEGTKEYQDFMFRGGEAEKGPMVQNIVGAGETEFAKKAGAEAATQFSTIANQGTAASRGLVELENLEANLANVETGGAAAFKAYLGSVGIATEGLGEIQAAQSAINRLVPQQRSPGSGPMSDADLALFKASLPALINQPGGNQIIIETIRAINEYDVAASIIAGQALDGEITQAEARKRLRELPNPLADFRAPKGAAKPAPAPVVIDGVTIQRIE